ncbi:MAG: phosphohydrolase [Acidobacteria bacterium]|nr:phosphohydrolase [Acidobacteriota bacterium]
MTAVDAKTARATFKTMDQSTQQDWDLIMGQHGQLNEALPGRVVDQLRLLGGDYGGFPVDRLHHSLMTAHLAETDGQSEEYVVCALLHDIGDILCPNDHPSIAAAILKPFVSEGHLWMVANHGVFQGYHFWHFLGGDRNAKDRFLDHEYYDLTEEFIAKYDCPAFDGDYKTPPLEHYVPMLESVLTPKPLL